MHPYLKKILTAEREAVLIYESDEEKETFLNGYDHAIFLLDVLSEQKGVTPTMEAHFQAAADVLRTFRGMDLAEAQAAVKETQQ